MGNSVRIGIHLYSHAPLSSLRWLGFAARLGGIDSLTVWDHFQHFIPRNLWTKEFSWLARHIESPHETYDPWTLLGFLAKQSGGMRLGVLVTAPVRRHPVAIAQAALTLAHMTRRAPILGLGLGEQQNNLPYGIDSDKPVDQLEEAIRVIRRCFTSQGPFDFSGKHYRLKGAVMDLTPPAGRTPRIWVAAHGPRMLRLTGMYGDGWVPHIVFPDEYAEKSAALKHAAEGAGRDRRNITCSNEMLTVVAPTEREAWAMLDTRAGRYSALLMPDAAWQRIGLQHPLGRGFTGYSSILPEECPTEVLEEALQHVPTEVVSKFVLWGTPKQVSAELRNFEEAGADHVALVPASTYVSRRAALWSLAGLRSIRRELQ
jgi:phthiodiolone/phenolphthiodiolone dimycocerosates ketoreductase